MKKLLLAVLILFLAGIFLGKFMPLSVRSLPEVIPTQKVPEKTMLGEAAVVKRVIDGDTIELETGEHLRYIGMDAPETVGQRKPVKCFGEESAKRNRELVEGKIVRLERDISNKDKYGRLLRYVWIGDKVINLELVGEGYATALTYPPDVKYAKQFVEAERVAQEAKLGLWRSCRW